MRKYNVSMSILQILLFAAISAFIVKSVYGIIINIFVIYESIGFWTLIGMVIFYTIFKEAFFPILFVLLGSFFFVQAMKSDDVKEKRIIQIISLAMILVNAAYSILAIFGDILVIRELSNFIFSFGYETFATIAVVASCILLITLIFLVLEKYRMIKKIVISAIIIPYIILRILSFYLGTLSFYIEFQFLMIIIESSALVFIFCILYIVTSFGELKTNALTFLSSMIIVLGIAKILIWLDFLTPPWLGSDIFEYGIELVFISMILLLFSLTLLTIKYSKKWMRTLKYISVGFTLIIIALFFWQLIFIIQYSITWGYFNLTMSLSYIPNILLFGLIVVITFLHTDLHKKVKWILLMFSLLYPIFEIIEFVFQLGGNPIEYFPSLQILSIICLLITGVSWSYLSTQVKIKSTKTI
ncbi:MAG: hypothetical protein KAU62_11445 [Candidatus Heimdallarchaeota archaeon]|nr:hypothetical protein [Candidatus Heimdallarchaeota archaeon]MCG3256698.1 hypothetical protein [Candidatus Heimdallarchaeota archaeon]MCK4611762.1 hypothetical protein [Candidatus Heimdallarchaeota archaeon]